MYSLLGMSGMMLRTAISLTIVLVACVSETPVPSRGAHMPQAGASPVAPDSGRPVEIVSDHRDDGLVALAPDPCAGMPCPSRDTAMPREPDHDGFSVAEGDCDDFSDAVNPGAYDVPNNGVDEDCQGGDALAATCDDMLALGDNDPLQAARALELCNSTEESSRRWGVISARWTTPDGRGTPMSPLQHGLLPGLGAAFAPRAGKALLALSSGVARAPGQADYTETCSDAFPAQSTGLPENFDGSSSSCLDFFESTSVVDAVALEIALRTPTNATALSFDSAFFTAEYPYYVCASFNDYFQVIVRPQRTGGSGDGNVVFDMDGNAVSVNNSYLRACDPGFYGGKVFECPLGYDQLLGSGFDACEGSTTTDGALVRHTGASTGWLHTEVPVSPGEVITLRITTWDSSDSGLDSLAIVDNFRFRLRDGAPPPEKPTTLPISPD